MTFKEFLKNNPADVEKAKNCKDIEEFKELAKSVGITYNDDKELQDAYDFVKGGKSLSADELEAASGGTKFYSHPSGSYSYDTHKGGMAYTTGTGKKQ